ncbi:MAG: hypothetical protein ACRDPC_17065 [Solirubrobacteraceae bacterium]
MEPLLVGLVVAALACPLHMWWAHRRGKQAVCCPPRRTQTTLPDDLEDLRARRRDVEAQLAEFEVREAEARQPSRRG